MSARTITPFCGLGDLTGTWEPEDDAVILPQIQAMINEGWSFFLLEAAPEDPSKEVRVPVQSVEQLLASRKMVITSEGLQKLVETGSALKVTSAPAQGTTGEVARKADEVAARGAVAVPPAKGG